MKNRIFENNHTVSNYILFLGILVCVNLFSLYEADAQGFSVGMLTFGTDTRSIGMGDNHFGESEELLIYGNPTSLYSKAKVFHVSASCRSFMNESLETKTFYTLGTSYRIGNHGLHAGYRSFGGQDIEYIGGDIIEPKDISLDIAYSYKIGKHFSASIGGSYIKSEILNSATTFAVNASAWYRNEFKLLHGADLLFGVGAGNIGGQIEYNVVEDARKGDLPMFFGAGGEFGLSLSQNHRVSLGLGSRYFYGSQDASYFTINSGVEYSLYNHFFVRGGYAYGSKESNYLTCGVGVKYWGVKIATAYIKGLGNNDSENLTVSLGWDF